MLRVAMAPSSGVEWRRVSSSGGNVSFEGGRGDGPDHNTVNSARPYTLCNRCTAVRDRCERLVSWFFTWRVECPGGRVEGYEGEREEQRQIFALRATASLRSVLHCRRCHKSVVRSRARCPASRHARRAGNTPCTVRNLVSRGCCLGESGHRREAVWRRRRETDVCPAVPMQ